MRRVMLMSLMLVLFAACGVAEPPPSVPSPVIQSAQTNAYPSPVVATAIPTNTPPTATSAPTAVASVTATPRSLFVTLEQSFSLINPQEMPTMLVGWSPDNRYLLYTQATSSITASPSLHVLLGRLMILDFISGQVTSISGENAIIGVTDYGDTYEGNEPQWTEECCEIVVSSMTNNQQQIDVVDIKGNVTKHLKTAQRSLTKYHNRKLDRVDAGSYFPNDKKLTKQLISQTGWITATKLTNNGLYTHNNKDLQYIAASGSDWTMVGKSSFFKNNSQHSIFRIQPSDNGAWLAVVTAVGRDWDRTLWIVDRDTQTIEMVDTNYKLAYPSWSGDTTQLTYSVNGLISVYDRTTHQHINVDGKFRTFAVWHPVEPKFAVINEQDSRIDIFRVSR